MVSAVEEQEKMLPIIGVGKNRNLIDSAGNTRLFRGMSVAFKGVPYIPQVDEFDPVLSFSKKDISTFQSLNLNVIRLSVPWVAVEPEEGVYDEVYLAKVLRLVKDCREGGIYVVIEAHQDLYASTFGGSGMPAWTITSDWSTLPFPRPIEFRKAIYPNGMSGFPSVGTGDDWGKFYASDACTRAFYGLYTDEKISEAFVNYWEKLAKTFKGIDNVIGYELINEPFIAASSTIHVPYNLFNRSPTERKYLQPLYDRIVKGIRKHDQDSLIFYEPATGSIRTDRHGGAETGFKTVPGGDEEKSKAVLSFHSYGPNAIDKLEIEEAITISLSQTEKLGGSLMLTEYDCEFVRGLDRIQDVLELCDKYLISSIGWQYKQYILICGSAPSGTIYDPITGKPRLAMMKLFSRPYPTSIAGELQEVHFDWELDVLRVRYLPIIGRTSIIAINSNSEIWGDWIVERIEGVNVSQTPTRIKIAVTEGWPDDKVLEIVVKLGICG